MPSKLTAEIFQQRANQIHNNKYKYFGKYINQRTKIPIYCPIHSKIFYQLPKNHMNGQGCPDCGKEYVQNWQKNNFKNFVNESHKRFGDKYSFPHIETEYINSHSKITIHCNNCNNEFIKIACDHLTSSYGGCMCHKGYRSYPEFDIINYIKEIVPNIIIKNSDRSILKGQELDIYLPEYKLAIEFNGLFWHSEALNKDKNYHLNKTIECEKQGIRLIQIFEDEYRFQKNIVLSKIKNLLNKRKRITENVIITKIKKDIAKNFLNNNHIQGSSSSTIYLGAVYDNKLVGVMSFKKTKGDSDKWELTRVATDINNAYDYIEERVFHYFIKNYNPKHIITFADRRWFTNIKENVYLKLGFKLTDIMKPEYYYIFNGGERRIFKNKFTKKILLEKYNNITSNMAKNEIITIIHAHKIWDCGLLKYEWVNKN